MKSPVSQVRVVFKTHLDMGFTDYARNVVRRYWVDYIPAALRLARQTRDVPERFVWTMGSWLVYHFLEKASAPNRRAMEAAIEAGDIFWHALPFTTHTELMDAPLFRQGLSYARRLDSRFGRKTRAAKMTDVPGHTRGILRPLAENGVRLLHLGVNPASTVPDVPAVFVWRSGGSEVVVMYEKVYGATTILPGGVALSVNLTGDNLGPQTPEEIKKTYTKLRKQFPNATVTAGSLDDVADGLWARRGQLPVVTSEIGDTWIHGVGTDPGKVARFRCLCRLRSKWLAEGKIVAGDATDLPLAENLLLTAEHTWGLDIKTHLRDSRAFPPPALRRSLGKPNFKKVAASWAEQRVYLDRATASLPTRLATEARIALADLKVSRPRHQATTALSLSEPFRVGPWTLALGPDGAIQDLRREDTREKFADDRHRLGSLGYQLFSPGDVRRFYRQYNTLDVDWARKDFTKPGLPKVSAAGWHRPRLRAIEAGSSHEARLTLSFSEPAIRQGAPAEIAVLVRGQSNGIDFRLEWRRKTPTRVPEALWLAFNPRHASQNAWRLEKLGESVDPLDVVRNGNRHLHAASGPVSSKEFSMLSLDTALVAPGHPSLLDFNNRRPDLRAGMTFNLYNNAWGTNFPMWYSDDAVFRFQLRWNILPKMAPPPSRRKAAA